MLHFQNSPMRRRIASLLAKRNIFDKTVTSNAQFYLTRAFSSTDTKKYGFFEKTFGVESNVASESFKSRWLMALPPFATHLCIGSPLAWSIMADAITREHGFVAGAASDWSMMEATMPLSIIFLMQGISASIVGKWQIEVGPRKALAASSVAFGGGMLLGAVGIHLHMLPLLYAGYGLMAGTGIGLAYTPPIQTLMQWYPDRKGIASGLTIAGFGSGALLFPPCVQQLMNQFAVLPEYLGPASNFTTKVIEGKLFAQLSDGQLVEVVQAGATELAKLSHTMAEGLYVVGSGSTGAAEALAVMGLTYFAIMFSSALAIKKPHPNYTVVAPVKAGKPGGVAPVVEAAPDLTLEQIMKTPQFHLLGLTFFCVSTGAMGMLSVAKPMMNEVFSAALPAIVTSAFASQYLQMLGAGNLAGRLGWASLSDVIGRRYTFAIFTAGCVPLYLGLPTLVEQVMTTGSTIPLYGFCASTVLVISAMGGVYAVLPAYEADLFGTKYAGAVHGRMLLYSAAAALTGPNILIYLRSLAEKSAIEDLLKNISPEKFLQAFGAPMEQASELLAAKTLTISKLLVLAPPGTIDPTPHLYDDTMYGLGGLMAVAVLAHGMVKPIPKKPIIDVTPVGSKPNETAK